MYLCYTGEGEGLSRGISAGLAIRIFREGERGVPFFTPNFFDCSSSIK